jgi:hypothetical protein
MSTDRGRAGQLLMAVIIIEAEDIFQEGLQ